MHTHPQNATFQVVLVIDSDSTDSETYALLLYEEVGENSCDTFVEIGFNEGIMYVLL